ncbi:asparagine synthase (glutamine-hydrolyzing) [Fulvivirgaceae bacterium BMA12]|uniref:asparagine synthase (glutamine-hydrolyzing) n=1 Tax=Agaribacillus aureus TaxID=3051825 RepID=A0ABT8LF14_9BACT|nr:asparagine synthase (glutamine-hydrolyzing) [Fulvivirgaceae bacterium BMA12]
MCGINLIIDKKNQLSTQNILDMNRALHHRGPDFDQFKILPFGDQTLYLGHTRLKILDLGDGANQPISFDPKRYYLIYNGEIYNFYALRNELIDKGCRFTTSSDTEVLLKWLAIKGEEGLESLHGMFVFVLVDLKDRRLLCARDPSGMKPFFYYEDDSYFIISSEIKGILASGLVKKELNAGQIGHYLNFRHAQSPATFFKHIYELPASHRLTWSGQKHISSYVNRVDSHFTGDDEEILKTTEDLLIDAVGNHLQADVPVGVFLSGGIDSTLLLTILKTHYPRECRTFSIAHNPKEGSYGTKDGHFARLAAKQFNTTHEELEVSPQILDNFHDFISKMDQPVGDSAAILTYFLSEHARQSVGVVLSGAGADEWFGGYNRHLAYYRFLKNQPLYEKLHPFIKGLAPVLPTGFNHPFRKNFQLFKKFAGSVDRDPVTTFQNMVSFQITNQRGDFADWNPVSDGNDKIEHYLRQALTYDRRSYLINDILTVNDRMTMLHGLEMRMPYLSHELTQYLNKIPATRLVGPGRKWILAALLNKYRGQTFVNRSKEGFGLPFGNWIKSGNANHLLEFLKNENCTIFEATDNDLKALITNQLDNHNRGSADNTLFLWSVIILGNWLEINFG